MKSKKKRIIINQEKAENIEFAKNMRDKSPVVQMLGYGLKDNVDDTEKLTKNMFLLDVTLKRGPEWVKENAQNFSELSDLFEMAEKIFDLQKQRAINENFSVNDFKKVKESSLVRDMHYEGKSLNLENKVKNPHLNIDFSRKGLEV